jgi:hypothetical protein
MPQPRLDASNCLNCGQAIGGGRYCEACGQEHISPLHPTRELLGQYMEDAFSLDNRLWRTTSTLLTRPGRLTAEYLSGRRQRYIRPLRLYLLASIVFFACFGLRFDPDSVLRESQGGATADSTASSTDVSAASPAADGSQVERLEDGRVRVQFDESTRGSVDLNLLSELAFLPVIGPRLAAREAELERMDPRELFRLGLVELMRHAPKAIFLLAPMTALVLKLLYLRRSRYYVEHFIFALHWHSLLFVVLLAILFNPWWLADLVLALLTPVYLLLALRHVYRQSWPRTLVKHQLVLWSYLPGSIVVFACLAFLSALTL